MAQTAKQVSMAAGKVEVSLDGADWTDISGHEQSVDAPAQKRISGEGYTHDGDTALIAGGKREPVEVTVNIVYTEEAADAFEVARALFEADDGTAMYVKWSPAGGSGGDAEYSTGAGEIVSFMYPPTDASSGDPIMTAFTVKCAALTQSTVAT